MAIGLAGCGRAEAAPPPHDQAALRIHAEVPDQSPRVGRDLAFRQDLGTQRLGERLGSRLIADERNQAPAQSRPETARVGVRTDEHLTGRHRGAVGPNAPAVSRRPDVRNWGSAVNARTGLARRAGKATRIVEWLQPATAAIECACQIVPRTQGGRDGITVEHLDVCPTCAPLSYARLFRGERCGTVNRMDPAITPGAASDAVAIDQRKHEVRSRADELDQP